MEKRTGILRVPEASCEPCVLRAWCDRQFTKACAVPKGTREREKYWEVQRGQDSLIGGVAPRKLPPVTRQPALPPIIHVHVDEGPNNTCQTWTVPLGVHAEDALSPGLPGCPLNQAYLDSRGLSACPKILVVSGKDRLLQRVCNRVGREFLCSIARPDIHGIVCPNFSDYEYVEHRVWLFNRAIGQNFTARLLAHGLPAVFHTYLEDTKVDQHWLAEYFRLNPSQHFLATGFERGAAADREFVGKQILLLRAVEDAICRPLSIVVSNVLTRLAVIRDIASAFPHRVHLLVAGLFQKSVHGELLVWNGANRLVWRERAMEWRRGKGPLVHNIEVLEQVLMHEVPLLYPNAASITVATGVTGTTGTHLWSDDHENVEQRNLP